MKNVHSAKVLEYRFLGLNQLASYTDALDQKIGEHVLWFVETKERDSDQYRAALSADEVYPEYTLSTALEVDGATVIVTGKIDLLYEANDVWHLDDYKTTDVHEADSCAGKYARQHRTYAWLLEEVRCRTRRPDTALH